MKIGQRTVGPGLPPYIIAELGVNHDGSIDRALHLTRLAAQAGADAIKLQFFRADLLMSRASRLATYQKDAGEKDPAEMLRRLELDVPAMARVIALAHELGIHAIVTIFSVPLIAEGSAPPWDAFKTASPDIIHRPLLDGLMSRGKPMIISTGTSTLAEVERALDWLRPAASRVAVLQCVSSYPAPDEAAGLGAMCDLARIFPGPVGYSDHTPHEETGGLAVAAGACVLEKHLTHSRGASGPDHAASLEVEGFTRYVQLARRAFAMLGDGLKRVHAVEADVRAVSRQSIVAARSLHAGETLRVDDLCFKRPGTGLEPWMIPQVLGRRVARDIDADTPLTIADLANDVPPT
jgi:sialic acid synthase SpsE